MDTEFLFKGLLIGFAIAAPVGPIGLLTIRRTLDSGWSRGFATGLGAATADAFYGAVAAFGLSAVSGLLVAHQSELRLAGGAFLLFLGVRTFIARPAQGGAAASGGGIVAAWLSSVLLTLTNPATILSFVAVFAGLGLGAAGSVLDATAMVSGVFLGSAAWWLILSGMTMRLRERLQPHHRVWINRASGALLAVTGLMAGYQAAI